jgi:multiple sugar transport system ATP-binding protein
MAEVVLEHVSKAFRGARREINTAVNDLSLRVSDGEFVVVVGPSGCGKTTLLRIIAGLEKIDQGTIAIGERVVNGIPAKDRDVAMVFQNFALYPQMNVYENMAFSLQLRKRPKAEIHQRVTEVAKMLGINDLLARSPNSLSGGEKQRVALGRAIVRRPKVFLFDEPLSNLDVPMRVQMRTEISRLHSKLRATMIYVTHDQVEAMTMGERIMVMNNGAIQQVGTPLDLYNHPATVFVAGFIGSPTINLWEAKVAQKGERVVFDSGLDPKTDAFTLEAEGAGQGLLPAYADKKIIVGLRPEMVSIAQYVDAPNIFPAMVELAEPMGADTFVHLRVAEHGFIARARGTECFQPGEKVFARFDMTKAHFFDATIRQRIG